ncbi:MAG: hypothetical protein V1728_03430 [Candidatus Micrarchaeota archaeon]
MLEDNHKNEQKVDIMDPLNQEIKAIYTLLTDATKVKSGDYSKPDQKRIKRIINVLDTNQIKAFAKTKNIKLVGERKFQLIMPVARGSTLEEFTRFLTDYVNRSRKTPRTSVFESLGKINPVEDWGTIQSSLQTEFRKCGPFSTLPDSKKVTVIEKARLLDGYSEYTFRYPVSATVKEWKNDDHDFKKPASVRFRVMTTGELLVTPPSKNKEHYSLVWEVMKKVLSASEVPVSSKKKEETKQQFLEGKVEATEAKFLHVENGKRFKLAIEGDGALEYLKNILGEKYQAFSEAFDLVSGVEKDGRKRTFI